MSPTPANGSAISPRMPVLLATVLAAFSAQQIIVPVPAPLSRRLLLTEVQLSLVITTGAASLAVTSPRSALPALLGAAVVAADSAFALAQPALRPNPPTKRREHHDPGTTPRRPVRRER